MVRSAPTRTLGLPPADRPQLRSVAGAGATAGDTSWRSDRTYSPPREGNVKYGFGRRTVGVILALALAGISAPMALADSLDVGSPGDERITVTINDSHAGGDYQQVFELVYDNETPDGTPVYIYVPLGAIGDPTVRSMDPSFDHNPADEFDPCESNAVEDYLITQAQIDSLGDQLADKIVAVNEDHFGPMDAADPNDPASDSLVTLVYNVQDEAYYDCATDSYTAGYFANDFVESGMNAIVIDAYDWANRTGDQEDNPDGQSYLYEGVIAHELEHLLQNYSDPGELSWVDEGLADFAVFLNGYPVGGSHLTYHQVFHRETSLTRWAGGLENYGASYTFFQYLWEQAGGNGDGTYTPDLQYDNAGGDLLIKMIFEEQADGIAGIQNAIDDFNAATSGPDLRSFKKLFKDWSIAVYLDAEGSDRFDIKAVDFGDPTSTRWTIDMANDVFWNNRGQYGGAVPEGRWANSPHVPGQRALPYGTSYETFRNPGPTFKLLMDGADVTAIPPHTVTTHWYAGYESQAENVLQVDDAITGGETIDFWTWYFIEEGWDFAYVQAKVGTQWVPIELTDDSGAVVTTDDDPHGNNPEGNGLTGTSGGAYFVDEPEYIHLTGELPANATDVRFVYRTDEAYLDTGWFVDDVQIDGEAATLSSTDWIETTGVQDNNWSLTLVSPCDLTPRTTLEGETYVADAGVYLYRFSGDLIRQAGFSTRCLRSTQYRFTAVISNLPTGDLDTLDAPYRFRVTNTSASTSSSSN